VTRGVALVIGLLVLTGAASTGAEVRRTAEAVEAGEARPAALLDIDSIDGSPVDFAGLLAEESETRIEVIARLTPPDPIDAGQVREQISSILADEKYSPVGEPSWLDRLLAPVFRFWNRIWLMGADWLQRAFFAILGWLGTGIARWVGLAILLAATGAATWALGRRRARELERRAVIERILELGLDPGELEELAMEAHERGDDAEAIRLRFVAGLLRLDGLELIEFAPGLSNGTISQRLGSETFDLLASQFDRVVYGREPVNESDHALCVAWWNTLLGVRR
jgi:hypothetical protein